MTKNQLEALWLTDSKMLHKLFTRGNKVHPIMARVPILYTVHTRQNPYPVVDLADVTRGCRAGGNEEIIRKDSSALHSKLQRLIGDVGTDAIN